MKELGAAILGIGSLVVLFGGIALVWWSVVQGTDHDPFYQPYYFHLHIDQAPTPNPKVYSV